MSKATHTLRPALAVSKLDPTDWTRATFRAAYAMARAMIRDRRTTTAATAWGWYLDAARKRFGASGWRIAQLAGRVVFDQRTATNGTSGSVDQLLHQGLVRRTRWPRRGNLLGVVPYRCATVDRVRAVGLTSAGSAAPLASSANAGLRVSGPRRLRQERPTRRQVAAAMAQDRRDLERGTFFALTVVGVLALREA